MAPLKVFVSYAHKDKLQTEVARLVEWLNGQEGIQAVADCLHAAAPPPQGWQTWMLHEIEAADVVLCICGQAYKKGFEKRDGGGKGLAYEGAIVTTELYESRGWNEKFYPILSQADAGRFVPTLLQPWNNYIALAEREKILRLIQHKQHKRTDTTQARPEHPPPSTKPAEGEGKPLPPAGPRKKKHPPAWVLALGMLLVALGMAYAFMRKAPEWQAIGNTLSSQTWTDGKAYSVYIEGNFDFSQARFMRLTFESNQAGTQFLLRLVPEGADLDSMVGVRWSLLRIPAEGVVEVPLKASAFGLKPADMSRLMHIAILSGNNAWERPLGQDAKARATFQQIEIR